jgi:hypothetical protein
MPSDTHHNSPNPKLGSLFQIISPHQTAPHLGSFFQLALHCPRLASGRIPRHPSPSFRSLPAKLASKRKHRPAGIGFVFSNLFLRRNPPELGSFFQLVLNPPQLASKRISRPPPPALRLRFAKLASKRKFPLTPDHTALGFVLTNLSLSNPQLPSKRFPSRHLLFFASASQKTPFLRLSPLHPELSRAIQRPPVMPNYS